MSDKSPKGPCPFCGYYPKGGFDNMNQPCKICGVSRSGLGSDGEPAKVPAGINTDEQYGAISDNNE